MKRIIFCVLIGLLAASCIHKEKKHLQISGRVVLKTENNEIVPLTEKCTGNYLYFTHEFLLYTIDPLHDNYEKFTTDENGYFTIDIPGASSEKVKLDMYKSYGDSIIYSAREVLMVCPAPSYELTNQELVLEYDSSFRPTLRDIYKFDKHQGRAPGDSLRLAINHGSLSNVKLFIKYYPNKYAQKPNNDEETTVFWDIPLQNTRTFSFAIPSDFDYDMYPYGIILEYNTTEFGTNKFAIGVTDLDRNNYVWDVTGRFVVKTENGYQQINTPVRGVWTYELDTDPNDALSHEKSPISIEVMSNENGEFAFRSPKVVNRFALALNADMEIDGKQYQYANNKLRLVDDSAFQYIYRSNDTIYIVVRDAEIVLE